MPAVGPVGYKALQTRQEDHRLQACRPVPTPTASASVRVQQVSKSARMTSLAMTAKPSYDLNDFEGGPSPLVDHEPLSMASSQFTFAEISARRRA